MNFSNYIVCLFPNVEATSKKRGCLCGCRFEFNVDKINFGTVSFGFLNSRTGGPTSVATKLKLKT